jgi:2-keto-4-pentenoate hydratase/2-oxohepta-3-ene-1,7-dioic acid hydratase in catechol pathway
VRLASFRAEGGVSWGIVEDERLFDARQTEGAPEDVAALLASADPAGWLSRLQRRRPRALGSVGLLAPVRPRQDLIALGLNYRQHVDETTGATQQSAAPRQPILFGKAASSVVGPGEDIRFDRAVTAQVDWEVELTIVIGRAGRDIEPAAALDHVFGYTIANDVSARDLQFLDGGQWYRGKSLDTFCPLGPWIVTRDELGEARGLRIALRVNGQTKQSATTGELIFGVPEIVASVSAGRTLRPGDIILTGTPGGVGFTRKPPEFLKDGDVVEAEIEGIGVLRNPVRETTRVPLAR